MSMTPNVLVVPALMGEGATRGFDRVRAELMAGGVNPVYLPAEGEIPGGRAPEYDMAVSSHRRQAASDFVDAQRTLLGRVTGLVVVNDAAEVMRAPDGSDLCEVPYSVGHVAASLVGVAADIYGPDSGRIFLSHRYPDGTELFSVAENRRSVVMARRRLLDLYPHHPRALNGNMGPAIAMAKGEQA